MNFSYDSLSASSEKMLDLCEQFEALPLTNAFDGMLDKYLIDQKITYRSETPIYLTDDVLSESLSGTFFFPHSSVLSGVEIDMFSDNSDSWLVDGVFSVGEQHYQMTASETTSTLRGEDSDGNSLEATTQHEQILSLLAHIIAQENETNPHAILGRLSEITPSTGFKRMLIALGNLNGTVDIRRTAQLPSEHEDRALIATFREQESPKLSGVNTKLMLNWELFDGNTETAATLNEIRQGGKEYSGLFVRYIERNGTVVPTDEYLISKQIPELYNTEGAHYERQHINSEDDQHAWLHTAATFMTTLGPFIDEFRHLDENY